nr:telomerase protein component 1 isoform X1 [Ciona intestinalis]|eukprot:XP_018666965.1 telomerase protein component 1 isoform X1 [Ciona intestinalis]
MKLNRCHLFVGILGERYGHVMKRSDLSLVDISWLNELPTTRSVTEYEMLAGGLNEAEQNESKSFFYFRDSNSLKKKIPKKFKQDFYETSEKKREKLKNLKKRIISSGLPLHTYTCSVGEEKEGKLELTGLNQFDEQVLEDLWQAILKLHPSEDVVSEVDEMSLIQVQTQQTFSSSFVGREPLIKTCLPHMGSNDKTDHGGLVVLVGMEGVGKSSMMSALIHHAQSKSGKEHVCGNANLFYYIGNSSPHCKDVKFMLHYFTLTLRDLLHNTEDQAELSSYEDTVKLFWFYVEKFTKKTRNKISMFIDNLDGISDENLTRNLQWLPDPVPTNVTLFVTCCMDTEIHWVLQNRRNAVFLKIPPLSIRDKSRVIRTMLSHHGKSLNQSNFNNQLQRMVSKHGASNPLYLQTACQYMRLFSIYETLQEDIDSLPHDLPKLLDAWLTKVEAGSSTLILGLIYCCVNGVGEEDVFEAVQLYKKCIYPEKPRKLKRSTFCRILNNHNIFFTRSRSGSFISFAHKIYADAVKLRYFSGLAGKNKLTLCHKLLAKIKANKLTARVDLTPSAYSNALLALPQHLAMSGNGTALVHLLSDVNYLKAKCHIGQTTQLIQEFNLLKQLKVNDRTCMMLHNILSTSHHMIKPNPGILDQMIVNVLPGSHLACGVLDKYKESHLSTVSSTYIVECMTMKQNRSHCYKTFNDFSNNHPTFAAISTNGQLLACGTTSGDTGVYNINDGTKHQHLPYGSLVTCLTFINDQFLASGHKDGGLIIWDVKGGFMVNELRHHHHEISSITSNPPTSTLISTSYDRSFSVWQLASNLKRTSKPVKRDVIKSIHTNDFVPNCSALHPVMRKVAIGLWDASIRIWDLTSWKRVAVLRGSKASVTSLVYSPCGTYLMSTALHKDGINVWSASTGSIVGTFGGNQGSVYRSLSYLPGNSLLAASGGTRGAQSEGILKLWSGNLGVKVNSFTNHEHLGNALSCRFNCDKTMVAVGYHDNQVAVFNAGLGKLVSHASLHKGPVTCVSWIGSKHGKLVVTGSVDSTLKVFSIQSETLVATCNGHTDEVLSVSTSDTWIASSSQDVTIMLWWVNGVVKGGVVSPTYILHSHVAAPLCVDFNQDGTQLVSCGKDRSLIYWMVPPQGNPHDKSIEPRLKNQDAHQDWITCCSWNTSSDHLVTGSNDFTLKIWLNEKCLFHMKGHTTCVTSVAYSYGCIVSTAADGEVKLWSHHGVAITTMNNSSTVRVNACDLIVTTKQQQQVEQEETLDFKATNDETNQPDWSVQVDIDEWDDKHKSKLPGATKKTTNGMEVDVVTVVTAHDDGLAHLWHPLVGEEKLSLFGHTASINQVATSDTTLVSCSLDGSVKCWDVTMLDGDSGGVAGISHDAEITSLTTSYNLVITGCMNGWLKVWVMGVDGEASLQYCLQAHKKKINFIEMLEFENKSDFILVTTSFDQFVKVWKAGRRNEMRLLKATSFQSPINVFMKKEEGSYLVSDLRGVVHLLDINQMNYVTITSKKSDLPVQFSLLLDTNNYKDIPTNADKFHTVSCTCDISDGNIIYGDVEGWIHFYPSREKRKVHNGKVTSVLHHNDIIITSSLDRKIKLWKKSPFDQVGEFTTPSAVTRCHLMLFGSQLKILAADIRGSVHVLRVFENSL